MSATTLAPALARAADAGAADAGESAPDSRDRGIVVTGNRSITEATSGTKSDLPLAETPQSVSVIDASTIAELGVQNLNQALRFVAGVTPETRGSSAEIYDQFKLRGFDVDTYLDGLKLYASPTGYAQPQIDMARLDRIEVVKGAASALYGAASPGGLVNEQSKLPIDRDFYGAVSGSYGNYNSYRVDGDVGGKVGSGVLWRLYGSANGADAQQRYGKRERQTISGAVTLGAGTSTDFTVLAAYSHDPYNGNYGVFPLHGTLGVNPTQGKIPTSFYGGEPGDFFKREQFGLTYIFNHDFGGGWKFRSSARYQYVKSRLGIVYTGGGYVSDTDYSRSSYATDERLDTFTYDNQLSGLVKTGAAEHNLLFGVDRQVAHSSELYAFGTATDINPYDPVYGTMPTPNNPQEVHTYLDPATYSGYDPKGYVTPTLTKAQQRQQGLYAQDQVSLGGLRVLLSGRYDWARARVDGQGRNDEKFTYRAAALYKTAIGLSPYLAWSTSFQPQSSQLQDGSIAKPTTGAALEAGAKYLVPGTDILISAAYFHIDQSNLVVTAPQTSFVTQSGKVRSQGVEVEAAGSLPYGFDFRLAFSRQSVKTIRDTNPDNVGKGLATVGKGGTSFNLNWTAPSGALDGLKLGGVVRHVDKTYAGASVYTPHYTVFDALLRYNLGKAIPAMSNVTLGANVTNIFDKQYLTSCYAAYNWCWYGNRRTVQGTIGFTW